MPYIPYTDEQKQLANSVDLPTFLRMRGEKLVPVGREFKLIYHDGYGKHDSITISGSQWYDHKNQIGGGPIKFMREHYGMNFQEAMQALLGHSALPLTHEAAPVMAKEKKEFRLPEANDNIHRVYAYLVKQRFIAPEVITHFAKRKLLYEDKKHHNAVFVGVDGNGVPRQAHKRSTTTFGNSFRQTIEGSDTKYSFAHFGKSNMLFVFEAPIDMMSFLTLYPKDWEQHSYIAMNGVYESAVLTALEEHPNLKQIIICTDNASLHAGEVRAQIVLALAISNAAMTKKYCSPSVSHSDNMRYSFRVWLLNLGLIGDEYKNCRTHLLKHLNGNIAWRHPEDGVAQRERLRQERIATREQEQRNESPCDERVGRLSIQGRHTFGFEQHPVSASGDPVSEVRGEVGETPDENLEAAVSDCDDFEETEEICMTM